MDTLRSRETDLRLGNSWQAPASAQIQCQSIGDRNDIYLALTEKMGLKICQQTDDRQDQEQEPERRGKSGQQTAHIHLYVMTLDLSCVQSSPHFRCLVFSPPESGAKTLKNLS